MEMFTRMPRQLLSSSSDIATSRLTAERLGCRRRYLSTYFSATSLAVAACAHGHIALAHMPAITTYTLLFGKVVAPVYL